MAGFYHRLIGADRGGTDLVLPGLPPLVRVFDESFTDPFAAFMQRVHEWDPPAAGIPFEFWQKPTVAFTDASFEAQDAFVEGHPLSIVNNQLHMEVIGPGSYGGKSYSGALLQSVSPHAVTGQIGLRVNAGRGLFVEYRLQFPAEGTPKGGNWCSPWLIGGRHDIEWSATGADIPFFEVDLPDYWNRDKSKLWPNVIRHNAGATGSKYSGGAIDTGHDLTAGFHRYGCWIGPDDISLWFDGEKYHEQALSGDLLAMRGLDWAVLLDHGVDTRGGTEIPNNPSVMICDYIRAYVPRAS